MERIYIVGDPDIRDIASSLGGVFVPIPSKHSFSSAEIHDFMVSAFPDDIKLVVLDVESNPSFCLDLSMHIRLSLSDLGVNSLCPIVFLTNLGIKSLLSINSNSQIALTEAVYISSIPELNNRLNSLVRLRIEDYDRSFLSRIIINPPSISEHDNHGLANEWGAAALYRAVTGSFHSIPECEALREARKQLYFKYVIAKSSDDIQSLALQGKQVVLKDYIQNHLTVQAYGRRVLLIDDMASRGWSYVLGLILRGAQIDVIEEKVRDFNDFSPASQQKIQTGEYDLYLLDLRLSGIDEDAVTDPRAFSGMKVLKEIKKENWGRQVIMFTASNKAWNLKALMNPSAGANGYYIKESPLSCFSETMTRKNLGAFCKDVCNCFERNYLKQFFLLKNSYSSFLKRKDKSILECDTQMKLAFDSADRAVTKDQYKYTFISVFQNFEILIQNLTRDNRDKDAGTKTLQLKSGTSSEPGVWKDALGVTLDTASRIKSKFELSPSRSIAVRYGSEKFSVHERLASIYLQLFKAEDNGLLLLLWEIIEMRNNIIHGSGQRGSSYSKVSANKFEFFDTYKNLTIFEDPSLRELIDEMIDKGMIRKNNGWLQNDYPYLFHHHAANSRIGIQLALYCLKSFFDNYKNYSG